MLVVKSPANRRFPLEAERSWHDGYRSDGNMAANLNIDAELPFGIVKTAVDSQADNGNLATMLKQSECEGLISTINIEPLTVSVEMSGLLDDYNFFLLYYRSPVLNDGRTASPGLHRRRPNHLWQQCTDSVTAARPGPSRDTVTSE